MALELVLVGGSVLSALWDCTVSDYNNTVNSLAVARKFKLALKKYIKEQDTKLKISENELKSFLRLLNDVMYLINKCKKTAFNQISNLTLQLEEGRINIEKYNDIIAKTNNPTKKDLYKIKKEKKIYFCEKSMCDMEKMELDFVKLVSNFLRKTLSEKDADDFVNKHKEIIESQDTTVLEGE